MGSKNRIELLPEHIQLLDNVPESGMGYHIVNIELRDGTKLLNRIVLNSMYVQLTEGEELNVSDIANVEIM